MTKKQQLLSDLRSVEANIIKKEKDFDIKTHLIEIFKILSGLFEGKEDVSKEDIVDVAERESRKRGIEDKYNNWNEIFGLEEKVVQGVKKQEQQLKINPNENTPDLQGIALASSKPYPDNFYVGKAIDNGSCFFDSFGQGLEQQTGTQVTVERLRDDCREFAQNNPPEWFQHAIAYSYDNNGQRRNETMDAYITNIIDNNRWGDPEVEGRILCEKYKVNLHISEYNPATKSYGHTVSGPEYTREIYSSKADEIAKRNPREICSVQMDGAKAYKLDNTIHVINKGNAHFEPLLDRNKSLAKQIQEQKLVQEQEDFLLAKKLQLDEILEYCNISKDSPKKEEVEKRFDELLAKNADGKIGDVVEQCVSDIKQRIQRSEEQSPSSLLRCGKKKRWIEKPFGQQQTPQPVK
ncbi:MAG: hypothetical protein LBH78_00615 [Rickettsiales bacterium]|jgi:hypothetical protein|nr:hypothetical protein [Rickettsiales bacterium]